MKIRKKEDGPIEYVKIEKCEDCGDLVIKEGDTHFYSGEVLAQGWEFIEIEREELKLFNEFLEDAREMLRVGWEFSMFTMYGPNHDHEEEDEE